MKRNDILKLIALLTMLIDHIGCIFFPHISAFRIIGRISFPIFAYLLTIGYVHTQNLSKYALRLLLFGILSQIPYGILFPGSSNIFFTLLWGLLILFVYERLHPWSALLLLPLAQLLSLEYGMYGAALILAFYHFRKAPAFAACMASAATFLYCVYHGGFLQLYAIFALPLIYYPWKIQIRLPKYAAYVFYPAHFTVLLLIKCFI